MRSIRINQGPYSLEKFGSLLKGLSRPQLNDKRTLIKISKIHYLSKSMISFLSLTSRMRVRSLKMLLSSF